MPDLPDYTKRQILIVDIAGFPQEVMVDHRKIFGVTLKTPTELNCLPSSIENIVRINHEQIKGLTLKDPIIDLSIPVSWEGPYLAYEPCIDAWKVKILEWAAGTLPISLSNDWARELGQVDLYRVLGATLAHNNPVIARLTDGSDFIDPRDKNWNLDMADVVDVGDRIGRELGRVHGNADEPLQQRATTYDLLVQLRHAGVEIDPTDIRILTNIDVVSVEQSDETKLKATIVATDLDIRNLTSVSDSVEVKQATAANLKAIVTQAEKDRTVTGTVTAEQATAANLNANVFTKHDNKTYKTAVFDASASGNLVAAVANKVIKLHALTIQAQGTVVVNLNNGSGGSSLMEWSFQAREGAVVPMANAPAYWAVTGVNTALYVTLSAAVIVTMTAIYSDDDAT